MERFSVPQRFAGNIPANLVCAGSNETRIKRFVVCASRESRFDFGDCVRSKKARDFITNRKGVRHFDAFSAFFDLKASDCRNDPERSADPSFSYSNSKEHAAVFQLSGPFEILLILTVLYHVTPDISIFSLKFQFYFSHPNIFLNVLRTRRERRSLRSPVRRRASPKACAGNKIRSNVDFCYTRISHSVNTIQPPTTARA